MGVYSRQGGAGIAKGKRKNLVTHLIVHEWYSDNRGGPGPIVYLTVTAENFRTIN